MVTGYEVEYYQHIANIDRALNRIANCMEAEEKRQRERAEFQREAAGLTQTETGAISSLPQEQG